MPRFLEDKLKKEYGANSKIPYKVMNAKGYMKGNKETSKGKALEEKHDKDMGKKYQGKGTKARLNTAADKMFFGSKHSK